MTIPDPNSKSLSTGIGCSFNANVPRVTSISSRELLKLGWERVGDTFQKDNQTITYNGATWRLNGNKIVQFLEDLN